MAAAVFKLFNAKGLGQMSDYSVCIGFNTGTDCAR